MADIGGDGTTTGQKLEGFQIGLAMRALGMEASTVRLWGLAAASPTPGWGYHNSILSEYAED